MDNFRNMFSLGGGGRANEITQGGRTNGTNLPTRLCHLSFRSEDQWDDTGVPFRDDTSAPSVSARLRAQGDQTTGEFATNDNVFALGGGGNVKPTTHHGRGYRRRHHQRKSSSGPRPTRGTRRYNTTHPIPTG
jgi:hypothetical protein